MITIVDYGLGNKRAYLNVYKRLSIEARVASTADELRTATKIILPGVGAFDHAMQLLHASGMRPALEDLVLGRKTPVLGVCVGMQLLADSSEEGCEPGLGWIHGSVRGFKSVPQAAALPLPHMGWNDVSPSAGNSLFKDLECGARFYFLHSFFFDCMQEACVAARAAYGIEFSCAIRSGNVYGVQFHPEKSHHYGAALLKNFADL